ncbi:MAG TPA: threonine synthase [Candidatus Omnitrophota bacterium]|nr:threonine synthase [Candidatus Omnitrophota bacterium]HOX10189.1 threonine synthase [Candidatus Omnitrophota bacterium]HPN65991.1 threonine synthase [Candidatus Omnitrophota bacterium]HRZ66809.1 threonine synthase [Candidatus Omnitrophota bacterium]
MWRGLIHRYGKYLPVSSETPVITLNEGDTPLIYSCHLSEKLGKGYEVYLKFDGANPTGSFKDRGMTMAVSKAMEEGSKAIMCASTGNTSASAAAYAARAGIKCIVLIPNGKIAIGKLAQALIYGAEVLAVDGNFDEALNLVRQITNDYPITLVNSLNPYRIEGQKTAAFEICEALEDNPDFHFIPVGNAGNITAYWKGYKEYKEYGKIKELPKMMGFQAEGAAPIVRGHIIEKPETVATAIRIGNPASWAQAEAARDESHGTIDMVSDNEILEAYKLLAAKDGVFAEPASAASVAGLLKMINKGHFKKSPDKKIKIVCVLTGHGLKDPDRAISLLSKPKTVKAEMKAVLKAIGI